MTYNPSMKDKHKNMLLGYLAGKSHSGGTDIFLDAINMIVVVSLSLACATFGGVLIHTVTQVSEEKAWGLGILILFISLFIFGKIFKRFYRLIYTLIIGIPVVFAIFWLLFIAE